MRSLYATLARPAFRLVAGGLLACACRPTHADVDAADPSPSDAAAQPEPDGPAPEPLASDGSAPTSVAEPASTSPPSDPTASSHEAPPACPGGPGCEPEPAPLISLPDTNLTMGAVQADGLRLVELACALPNAPLLGGMAIVAGLGERRPAFDRCAPRGDAVIATWTARDQRTTDASATGGARAAVDRCVADVLRTVHSPFDATCSVVLLVGDAAGADARLEQLRAAR